MGHALVGHFLEYTDPVHKISVISRGQALGFTISLPTEDKFLTTKERAHGHARHDARRARRRGGRVRRDHHRRGQRPREGHGHGQADDHALRHERGARTAHPRPRPVACRSSGASSSSRPTTRTRSPRQIDDEIRRIIEEAHQRAKDLLAEKRELLDRISKILMERETIDAAEFEALVDGVPEEEVFRERDEKAAPAARRRSARSREKRQRVAAAGAQAGARESGQPRGDLTPPGAALTTRGPATRSKQGVRLILEGIGEDPDRPGLLETPRRVADMYEDIFSGIDAPDPAELLTAIPGDHHREMVLIRDIDFYSVCEHHLLPFVGMAHVAYIPSKDGQITGLSKLARVVRQVAARPQLQERITTRGRRRHRARAQPARRARAHPGRAPVHVACAACARRAPRRSRAPCAASSRRNDATRAEVVRPHQRPALTRAHP